LERKKRALTEQIIKVLTTVNGHEIIYCLQYMVSGKTNMTHCIECDTDLASEPNK